MEEAERDEEEDDVSTDIQAWYEKYKQKQQQIRAKEQTDARHEGRNEGRREEARHALFTVLRARGIAVPERARERMMAEREVGTLERWIERASVLSSIVEVLDEPTEGR